MFPLKEFVDVLSRTLFSLLSAAAVGGGILSAPAQAAPAGSSIVNWVKKEEIPGPFTQSSYHVFPNIPETFAPLKRNLPSSTTLTALGRAEGYCAVPAIVNHPDGSHEAVDIIIYVDYMIDTGFLGSVATTLTSSFPRPAGGTC